MWLNYASPVQAADTFARAHHFSPSLRGRIKAYYAHVAAEDMLSVEERCLDRLSPELREDVLLFLYHDLLQSMPLFATKSTSFMLHIVQVVVPIVAPPGEFLVSAVCPWPPTALPRATAIRTLPRT